MSAAIEIHDLRVSYGDQEALREVTLTVPEASSLAVIGPNGSGKSTLLGAVAGTLPFAGGTIEVLGGKPAYVLQSTNVDRSLPITVRETVSLGRYPSLGLFRRFTARDRDIVEASLERLKISEFANTQLHSLSGGQRQRVLVAQGLAQDSSVLLLDEPITGLDVPTQQIIHEVIEQEVENGRAVVVTTHSLDDARRCDQVLLLDGAPVAVGTPETVLSEEHLRHAFGSSFVKVGDQFILDDPHHHHVH